MNPNELELNDKCLQSLKQITRDRHLRIIEKTYGLPKYFLDFNVEVIDDSISGHKLTGGINK